MINCKNNINLYKGDDGSLILKLYIEDDCGRAASMFSVAGCVSAGGITATLDSGHDDVRGLLMRSFNIV